MNKEHNNAHQRLLRILDSLDAFVYVADMDTHEVLFANQTAKKLFGEIEGTVCWESVYSGQKGPCDFCSNKHLLDPKGKATGLYKWENRNSVTNRWYDLRDQAIEWAGGRMVRLGIATDITNQKLWEKELGKAKEKAEKEANLKEKFVCLVAHDLRGPVINMLSFLKILYHDFFDLKKKKELRDKAISAGEKMLKLIDNLLNFSRVKGGKIKPEFTFFDAHGLGVDALDDFGLLTDQKGIGLINNIPEKTRIYADPILYYEVIRNLVANAVKFCDQGDSITLYVPKKKPYTIAVKDTGIGMDTDKFESISKFEVKESSPGTRGETGTGLGLFLCHNVMEAHNGSLALVSKKGQGSTFYAHLPQVRPLILLVDGSKRDRNKTIECLKSLDSDFLEAENGYAALGFLQEKSPHLLITALMIPEMDGFRLIENIRKNLKTESLPIIMMTSKSDLETNEKALQVGANDFAAKPLVLGDFIPRVKKILGGKY